MELAPEKHQEHHLGMEADHDHEKAIPAASNGASGSEGSKEPAFSPRAVHGIKWVFVILAILSSILLYALDNTIVANIIPSIIQSLGHADQLAWVSVGYMLGGMVVAMPFGRIYGIFEAKKLYIVSIILFMGGSALCGGAPNMPALIVGRVIAGAGGNGMYVGVVTLISVNTTERERPMYLGLIGLIYGIGTVIGPIIGGAFADSSATWRWGFYINLVVGGLFTPVYLFLLPTFSPQPNKSIVGRLRTYDGVGTILQSAFLLTGIIAINFGGTLYAWDSGAIIALFVVSAVTLIVFGVQQTFNIFTTESTRLFPIHFLKRKEPVLLFILMAANNAGAFVLMYFIPLYFQFTRGVGSLNSGVRLLALIIAVTITIMANGAILSKTGLYKPWYVVGSILLLVSGVLLSQINITTPAGRVYGYEILAGVGIGAYLQAGYAVIQGLMEPQHLSYAVTFMLLAQLGGIALSLSISGAIFVNTALAALQQLLPNVSRDALVGVLTGTSGKEFFAEFSQDIQHKALELIMDKIQKVFILTYVAGAVSLVASVFLSNKKLNLGPAAGA